MATMLLSVPLSTLFLSLVWDIGHHLSPILLCLLDMNRALWIFHPISIDIGKIEVLVIMYRHPMLVLQPLQRSTSNSGIFSTSDCFLCSDSIVVEIGMSTTETQHICLLIGAKKILPDITLIEPIQLEPVHIVDGALFNTYFVI